VNLQPINREAPKYIKARAIKVRNGSSKRTGEFSNSQMFKITFVVK